jgi:cell division protein FtsB
MDYVPPVLTKSKLTLSNNYRQAKALQSSLQALAERIDAVKSDHDKLENENKILQDYIGGLTRNMTKGEMTRSTKARKAQK